MALSEPRPLRPEAAKALETIQEIRRNMGTGSCVPPNDISSPLYATLGEVEITSFSWGDAGHDWQYKTTKTMKLYKAYFVTLDEDGEYGQFIREENIVAKSSQNARDKAIALYSAGHSDRYTPGEEYDVIIKEIG